MFDNTDTQARIGRLAFAMAWFALVLGQLHALARHQTVDGREDLKSPLVRAWSDPARSALRPLLDWASPDTVYVTYGKVWLPIFVAFTLAAFAVHRRRTQTGAVRGAERWAWRLALTGYVLACAAVGLEYWTQWGAMDQDLLDTVFLFSLPAVLFMVLTTTFLGVVLIRRGLGLPAWLLALVLPEAIAITSVTAMGNLVLPIAFAYGILGRRLLAARAPSPSPLDKNYMTA
jgi:hypothetical protein